MLRGDGGVGFAVTELWGQLGLWHCPAAFPGVEETLLAGKEGREKAEQLPSPCLVALMPRANWDEIPHHTESASENRACCGPETPPRMSPGLTAAWCCVLCCLSSPPAAAPALHPHGYQLEGMGVGEPGCPCCRAGFKELSCHWWADFLMPPWFVTCPGLPVSVCQSLPNATVIGKWRSRQWEQITRASPCWGGGVPSAPSRLQGADVGSKAFGTPPASALHPRGGSGSTRGPSIALPPIGTPAPL